jgi:hypothetical protein
MKKVITLVLSLICTGNSMRAMEETSPKAELNCSTFERLPIDEKDRWQVKDAARRYQEYLIHNKKSDTEEERKTFIQANNQNCDCCEIHDITQINQGVTLLRQEKFAQQISCNNHTTASSGAVIAYLLQQEQSAQAKKKSQSQERTIDTQDTVPLPSPSTSSSVTSYSHTGTEFSWLSRKSRAFDNDSPLMQALKDEKKSLFDTLPKSSPGEESDNEATNNYDLVDNNSQQTLPKGALPIPLRSSKRNS